MVFRWVGLEMCATGGDSEKPSSLVAISGSDVSGATGQFGNQIADTEAVGDFHRTPDQNAGSDDEENKTGGCYIRKQHNQNIRN